MLLPARRALQAERDARIQAELEALGETEREREEEALRAGLAPLGLAVHDVAPDGHCLYRSIGAQAGEGPSRRGGRGFC